MRALRTVIATMAALLVLVGAVPAFAWSPEFQSAPYTGSVVWWRWGSRVNWEAYGIKWSQQGKNAMTGDQNPKLDATADCRDGYTDDGDKLDFAGLDFLHTDIPWWAKWPKDDCAGNPPIGGVEEEVDLWIDAWPVQPEVPYYYWVEYDTQYNPVGGELNISYQRDWPPGSTHDNLDQRWYFFPAGAGSYDELNKAMFYKGGPQDNPGTHWRQSAGWPRAYGTAVELTNFPSYPDPWFSFGFTGSSVTWVYTMASNRGTAKVYIDGQLQGTVNQYAPPSEVRWQAARTWQVSQGEHWFKVEVNGDGVIDVDRMIVDVSAVAPSSSPYDDFNSAVGYIGSGWWSSTGYPSAYNSSLHWTCHYSSEDNDGAYMFFTGSRIGYIYTKIWNRGIVNVTIDGQVKGNVDLYDPNILWQQETSWDVGSGIHNIQVTCTWAKNGSSQGYQVDLDAFRVSN